MPQKRKWLRMCCNHRPRRRSSSSSIRSTDHGILDASYRGPCTDVARELTNLSVNWRNYTNCCCSRAYRLLEFVGFRSHVCSVAKRLRDISERTKAVQQIWQFDKKFMLLTTMKSKVPLTEGDDSYLDYQYYLAINM